MNLQHDRNDKNYIKKKKNYRSIAMVPSGGMRYFM